MHITHPLKRNIFTGLWHRTLPTPPPTHTHTKQSPHRPLSQLASPPSSTTSRFSLVQTMNCNAGVTPDYTKMQTKEKKTLKAWSPERGKLT